MCDFGDTTALLAGLSARGGKAVAPVGYSPSTILCTGCAILLGSPSARPADREVTVAANANGGRRVGRICRWPLGRRAVGGRGRAE